MSDLELKVFKTYVTASNSVVVINRKDVDAFNNEIFVASNGKSYDKNGGDCSRKGISCASMSYDPIVREFNNGGDVYNVELKHATNHQIDHDISGREQFEIWRSWGEERFGPASSGNIFRRTMEEMKELEAEVGDGDWTEEAIEEAADVVLVLTRVPRVWDKMQEKMKKNEQRDYFRSGDGTGFHHE